MTEIHAEAIPSDAVLLHIGPHKTGTTAIQGALRDARTALADQGVIYPGTERSHHEQTRWAINPQASKRYGSELEAIWEALCLETRQSDRSRVVISSEMLDLATDEQAASIVQQLGGQRVHVVVTLRPLGAMLPSIWQQGIHGRRQVAYEQWLRDIFEGDRSDELVAKFWHQHQHDELIRRWIRVVGAERMHVVVVDKAVPDRLYRAFEQLLGLADGTLNTPEDQPNRSLTAPEVELLRRVNVEFAARGFTSRKYRPFIREGLNMEWKLGPRSIATDPRIGTPKWALQAAAECAGPMVAAIRDMKTSVVGDLDVLQQPQTSSASSVVPESITSVPIDLAVSAIIGTMNGADAVPERVKAKLRAQRILGQDGASEPAAASERRTSKLGRAFKRSR